MLSRCEKPERRENTHPSKVSQPTHWLYSPMHCIDHSLNTIYFEVMKFATLWTGDILNDSHPVPDTSCYQTVFVPVQRISRQIWRSHQMIFFWVQNDRERSAIEYEWCFGVKRSTCVSIEGNKQLSGHTLHFKCYEYLILFRWVANKVKMGAFSCTQMR